MDQREYRLLVLAGLLYRRFGVISITTLVTLILSAATLLLSTTFHTATALILVGNAEGGPGASGTAGGESGKAWLDSEIEILRSDAILLGVIDELDLVSDPAFGFRAELTTAAPAAGFGALAASDRNAAIQKTLRHVRSILSIERLGETYLIAIKARAPDPVKAALIANAVANRHMTIRARFTTTPAHIVSPASSLDYPGMRDMPIVLAASGFGGFLLGIAIALGSETATRTITSSSQLSRVSRAPVLGTVPRLKVPSDLSSLAQFLVLLPLSHYSESIRQIRMGIDQHLDPKRPASGELRGAVIMISSAVTGEGRTSMALSLARAYATAGRRTLVIDCDLRRPSVHRHLDIEPHIGLIEYLSGRAHGERLASLIILDSETGMGVVVGSQQPELPTDQLLTGSQFRRLLDAATENFEIVILDTPAILPVVDSLYLARYADAIVTMVKSFSTTRSEVRTAMARLDGSRHSGALVFTVLNQHDNPSPTAKNTRQPGRRG